MSGDKKFKSIIDELDNYVPETQKHQIIEVRATNAIVASINVTRLIYESFTAEEAEDLIKKMLLAIKSQNPKKFVNKIRYLGEQVNENKRDKS